MIFFNRQIQVFSQPAGYGYAYAPVGEKFSLVSKRTYNDPRIALNDACLDAACGHVVSSDGIAIASTTKGRCLCASNLANKVFRTNLVGQEVSGFYQDPSRRVKIIKALEQQGFLFELIDFIDADGKPLNYWLAIKLVQLPVDTLIMSTLQDNNTPLPFSRAFLKPS